MRADDIPSIDPGQAPNGLVFRVRRRKGPVIWFERLSPTGEDDQNWPPAEAAERHTKILLENAPCIGQLFDGDSGELLAQCIEEGPTGATLTWVKHHGHQRYEPPDG